MNTNNDEKMVILGGVKLSGEVRISGAKNSAVAILVASILVGDKCVIENVPHVSDIVDLIEIINGLGGRAEFVGEDVIEVDCSELKSHVATGERVRRIRASSYLMGALLGRLKRASVDLPGGCNFGVRPIDQHIKGFEALGAYVDIEYGTVNITADSLRGNTVYMDVVSVGATIDVMLAAVLADGLTVIDSAAKEPHVVDVANFLNSMGADIRGAGTDVIRIRGVESLHGGTFSVIPDQIEAGTFMIAAAATGGDVTVTNIIPTHMESLTAKLEEMGVGIEEFDEAIRVYVDKPKLRRCNVKTQPYPGFPTDLQPQMLALLTAANGTSIMKENVWENRFEYVPQLNRMGASINVEGTDVAVVEGGSKLIGAPVCATDLRAGAALVIAALMADGVTEIYNLKYIDRGYEKLVEKLRGLGAQVTRRCVNPMPEVLRAVNE
ncbi:MAG TPA: UDP-N-acetylglucosamine 1-carboxyvinyltransferase [Candidatus Monoglobus merdigallinarum]|uniref:UDP-N-acetylglucosamine 1-carboxyvinyltransferase n=1 Tax=Candidatus Monoglobus merdigallinarum TaxID=2838698 RepID=A0A9D1PPW5_9FIRM|nr:UDP-N-acetylglucosamine 1-carboxyvinyltransferase [Candidatus Monoglobus merdigallinarum]